MILDGLLRFRAALHELGMTGFQWLDGSFMEDIETNDNRPPNDIDVVIFYTPPEGVDESALAEANPDIFRNSKDAYSVDAYFYRLGLPMDQSAVERVSYWYSLWSHKRDHSWKGYIQIDLDPEHDAVARVNLNVLLEEEVAHGIA